MTNFDPPKIKLHNQTEAIVQTQLEPHEIRRELSACSKGYQISKHFFFLETQLPKKQTKH